MSSMIRKMKRKNKKSYTKLSFCSVHGPYTKDNLCLCYDNGGIYEKIDYETNFRAAMNNSIAKGTFVQECICPIHGIYSPDDLCECYDANGELKEGWDKNLK